MSFHFDGADCGVLTAAVDLSAKLYYAVVVDSTGQLALPTTLGQRVSGILQDAPTAGVVGTFRDRDGSKAVAGGTIAKGALITTAADGRLVASVAPTVDFLIGIALESATANAIFHVRMGL